MAVMLSPASRRRPFVGTLCRLMAAGAVVAMLLPALTLFAPDLAGRTPDHQHVYRNGVAVPHVHPYDSVRRPLSRPMTFCAAATSGAQGHAPGCSVAEGDAQGAVGFLFGTFGTSGVGGDVLPTAIVAVVAALAAAWLGHAFVTRLPERLLALPATPPPRP